jgi:uncharacterized protein YjlB
MRHRRNNVPDEEIQQFVLPDDGRFPNSKLPVLLYKGVLDIPFLFPAVYVKNLFEKNNWYNAWDYGIFEYHHYHSITHEVLGVYKRKTTLLLGGENGIKINIEKGDVLVIPAGVAHKNLGKENDVKVIGAYPNGKDYDMNYGKPGERPRTDQNIAAVPIPSTDPVSGFGGLTEIWIANY